MVEFWELREESVFGRRRVIVLKIVERLCKIKIEKFLLFRVIGKLVILIGLSGVIKGRDRLDLFRVKVN